MYQVEVEEGLVGLEWGEEFDSKLGEDCGFLGTERGSAVWFIDTLSTGLIFGADALDGLPML